MQYLSITFFSIFTIVFLSINIEKASCVPCHLCRQHFCGQLVYNSTHVQECQPLSSTLLKKVFCRFLYQLHRQLILFCSTILTFLICPHPLNTKALTYDTTLPYGQTIFSRPMSQSHCAPYRHRASNAIYDIGLHQVPWDIYETAIWHYWLLTAQQARSSRPISVYI